MTLEAGKEMDKRCVLNWLNEVYVTPSRAFNEYTDDELKTFAHDALVLLKEQRKKGHWIKSKNADDRWHECSECGTITEKVDKNGYKLICNYCRICGADMT